MHEASLVQGLLQIIENALQAHNIENPGKSLKVTGIVCEAGLLACFEPETLKACLEIFSEGTACENASLEIETAPLACKCQDCSRDFNLEKRNFSCPFCKGVNLSFTGGNGLILKELKVEVIDNG